MSKLASHPEAASDETAWEGFTADTVILQRDCPDCDKGLLVAPARWCPACGGSGYLTRVVAAGVVS